MYGSGHTVCVADQNYSFDERPIAGDADAGAGLAVLHPEVVVGRRGAEAFDLREDRLTLLELLEEDDLPAANLGQTVQRARRLRRRTGNRTTISGPGRLADRCVKKLWL